MSTGDPWGEFARDPRVALHHHLRAELDERQSALADATTPGQLHERAVADWRAERREAAGGFLNLDRIPFTRQDRIDHHRRRLERKQATMVQARRKEESA